MIRPDGMLVQPQRLIQQIRFEQTYLPRRNIQGLGFYTLELNGTLAFPLFARQPPFFVTPGFAVNYVDGPSSGAHAGNPDLPPNLFDAYLDTGWRPVVNQWLSGDLGVRVGVYSDFQEFTKHSIRIISRGLGIVTLSPKWQIAAGVVYLDRNKIKILPAGGVIWTPNPDIRWEMLFPRPKLAGRWTNIRNTELWIYVSGEYGGGAWTIRRADGAINSIDYNDIRVNLGLETHGINRLRMWAEVGFVWNRKLEYFYTATPNIPINDTVMLRGGVAY
jgi:hypothetical protein